MHAYQLTSKFESFKKLGKQSGCLFYIPAWNTSKTDPVTGFVNMLDTRYENSDKARNFFSRFDSIRYNATKDWFEFELDYNNFNESREKTKGTRTRWTLCTYGTRVKTFRDPEKLNQWANKPVNLTEEFKKVFADAEIDINGNLKESICQLKDKKDKKAKSALEPLMGLMKLLLQMRNSITNTEVDYMLSPVQSWFLRHDPDILSHNPAVPTTFLSPNESNLTYFLSGNQFFRQNGKTENPRRIPHSL